ncbi:hypothetical protein A2U01_0085358, partial [Trifolium medium]|nr:hypothetical protein [Trifolium medium]
LRISEELIELQFRTSSAGDTEQDCIAPLSSCDRIFLRTTPIATEPCCSSSSSSN